MSSPVASCFNVRPLSALCVRVISWSFPNLITELSAKNKSLNSFVALPRSIVPDAFGRIAALKSAGFAPT